MSIDYIVIFLPKTGIHYLSDSICGVYAYSTIIKDGGFTNKLDHISPNSNLLVYNLSLGERFFKLKDFNIFDFKDYIWCRKNNVPDNFKISNIPQIQQYKRFYNNIDDYLDLIPRTKLSKILGNFCKQFEDNFSGEIHSYDQFYSNSMHRAFSRIERSFIKCDTSLIKKYYPKVETSGLLPTKYNLHTTTGRPSCAYGGINFLALNKESGVRSAFISRHESGLLLDFDFDAYDLRIMDRFLLKDPFPDDINVHEYLACEILGKDKITEEEYKTQKLNSFWYLFGNSQIDVNKFPPFYKKVAKFRENLYSIYKEVGMIPTFGSGRPMTIDNLGNISEFNLFNYYIQAFETEISSAYINLALGALKGLKSKLVLYTYDSLLIDTHPEEVQTLITKFKYLIPKHRLKLGKNYGEMQSI